MADGANKRGRDCSLQKSCDVEITLDQDDARLGEEPHIRSDAVTSPAGSPNRPTMAEAPGAPVAYVRSPRTRRAPLGLPSGGLVCPRRPPRSSAGGRPFLSSPKLHAVELKIEGPHLCDLPQDFAARLRTFLSDTLAMPPLHIAVGQGCIHLVVLLLELGRGAAVTGPAARRLRRRCGGGGGGGSAADAVPARLLTFMREVLPGGGAAGAPGHVTVRHNHRTYDLDGSDAAAAAAAEVEQQGGLQDAAGPPTAAARTSQPDPASDGDCDAAAAAAATVAAAVAAGGNSSAASAAALALASAGESSGGTWGSSGAGPATRSWAAWTVSPGRRAVASAADSSLCTSGPGVASASHTTSSPCGGGAASGAVEAHVGADAAVTGARSSRGFGAAFRAVAALGFVPEVPTAAGPPQPPQEQQRAGALWGPLPPPPPYGLAAEQQQEQQRRAMRPLPEPGPAGSTAGHPAEAARTLNVSSERLDLAPGPGEGTSVRQSRVSYLSWARFSASGAEASGAAAVKSKGSSLADGIAPEALAAAAGIVAAAAGGAPESMAAAAAEPAATGQLRSAVAHTGLRREFGIAASRPLAAGGEGRGGAAYLAAEPSREGSLRSGGDAEGDPGELLPLSGGDDDDCGTFSGGGVDREDLPCAMDGEAAAAAAGGSSGGGGGRAQRTSPAWRQPAVSARSSAGGAGVYDETLAFSHATLGPTLADRLDPATGSVAAGAGWPGPVYPPAPRNASIASQPSLALSPALPSPGQPPAGGPWPPSSHTNTNSIRSVVTFRPPGGGGAAAGGNASSGISARSLLGGGSGGGGGGLDLLEPSSRLLMPQVPLELVRLQSQSHTQPVELLSPAVVVWPLDSAGAAIAAAADSERGARQGRLGLSRLSASQQQPLKPPPPAAQAAGLCVIMRCPDLIASPSGNRRRRRGGGGAADTERDDSSSRLLAGPDGARRSVGGGRGSNDRSDGGSDDALWSSGARRRDAAAAPETSSVSSLGQVSQLVAWNRAGAIPLMQLDDSAEGCTRATLLLPQPSPPPPPLPQPHQPDAQSLPLALLLSSQGRGGLLAVGGAGARAGPALERARAAGSATRLSAEALPASPAGHAGGGGSLGGGSGDAGIGVWGRSRSASQDSRAAAASSAGASPAASPGGGVAAVGAAPAAQLLYLAWRRGQSLGPPCPLLLLPGGLEDVVSELQAIAPPPGQTTTTSYQAFLSDLGIWLEALHASSSWSLASASLTSLAAAAAAAAGGRQRSQPSWQSTAHTLTAGTATGSGSVPMANATTTTITASVSAGPSRVGSCVPLGHVAADVAAAAAAAPWRAAAPGSAPRQAVSVLEPQPAASSPLREPPQQHHPVEDLSPFRTAVALPPFSSHPQQHCAQAPPPPPPPLQQQRSGAAPQQPSPLPSLLQPSAGSPRQPQPSQPLQQTQSAGPSALTTASTTSSETDERLARFAEELLAMGCDLLVYAVARGVVATARLVMGLLMTHGSRVVQRASLAAAAAAAASPAAPASASAVAAGESSGATRREAQGDGPAAAAMSGGGGGEDVRQAALVRGVLESCRDNSDCGRTLLHLAVLSGSLPMMRLLLESWPQEYGMPVSELNRLDRTGLPPVAMLRRAGNGAAPPSAEFAAAAAAMLAALGPPLLADGSEVAAAAAPPPAGLSGWRWGLQSVQESSEASSSLGAGVAVTRPTHGSAAAAGRGSADVGSAGTASEAARELGLEQGWRVGYEAEYSGALRRRVRAASAAASAPQVAVSAADVAADVAAALTPRPADAQPAGGAAARPLLPWALWAAVQMLLGAVQALVALLFAMPRARSLPPAASLLTLPGALLWLPCMCLLATSCLTAAALLLPPPPPPLLALHRHWRAALPSWLPAAFTSAGRTLSTVLSLAAAVELPHARHGGGAAAAAAAAGGGGWPQALMPGGSRMCGAEVISRIVTMTLAPSAVEAAYVEPPVRAMLLISEYGTPLLYVVLYDGFAAAVMWLSYAAANVVLGLALVALMDGHARARAAAAAAATAAAAVLQAE
ncbi:hypothetical protein PLESTB_001382800 [Pleodorina starrii]|uniref:ANK_REP_REGION domain-containing protein n=1 Tax=Pleodorina starrii TaxID=330485 RepID=A0A9W6F7K4_9CHLO|nr:hypothetical protein PLESTM_000402300 [Pleodorina starrii]GLC58636.1 hypothetical protein PLESTB_001382800 [Pleodorina starrii]GLC67457.1 hypothetical protein PLESTF_000559600 [Pleodorina starrii]